MMRKLFTNDTAKQSLTQAVCTTCCSVTCCCASVGCSLLPNLISETPVAISALIPALISSATVNGALALLVGCCMVRETIHLCRDEQPRSLDTNILVNTLAFSSIGVPGMTFAITGNMGLATLAAGSNILAVGPAVAGGACGAVLVKGLSKLFTPVSEESEPLEAYATRMPTAVVRQYPQMHTTGAPPEQPVMKPALAPLP